MCEERIGIAFTIVGLIGFCLAFAVCTYGAVTGQF
jgi:hypothetical protein